MNLAITLAHGSEAEALTREALRALAASYPLDRYTVTDQVRIEEGAQPHSHPVLTLNTAERADPVGLLAQYLHEQMHWMLGTRARTYDPHALLDALQRAYPGLPVARPDGSGDRVSTYFHLAVCSLELDTLTTLVGREAADDTVHRRAQRFYRAIYALVVERREDILDRMARWGGGAFWQPPAPV